MTILTLQDCQSAHPDFDELPKASRNKTHTGKTNMVIRTNRLHQGAILETNGLRQVTNSDKREEQYRCLSLYFQLLPI